MLGPTVAAGVPGQVQRAATNAPVVRLGQELELGKIIGSVVYTDGGSCLADDADQRIHCFGPEGEHRWSVGARGEGPGETRGLYRLAFLPGGQLAAFDLGRQAIHVYTTDGKLERMVRLPVFLNQVMSFVAPSDTLLILTGVSFAGGDASDFAAHAFNLKDSLGYLRSFAALPVVGSRELLAMYGPGFLTLTDQGTLLYNRRFPLELVEYSVAGRELSRTAPRSPLPYPPDSQYAFVRTPTRARVEYRGTRFPAKAGTAYRNGDWTVLWRTESSGRLVLEAFDRRTGRWLSPLPWRSAGSVVPLALDLPRHRVLVTSECVDGAVCVEWRMLATMLEGYDRIR